ncbi:DUF4185 domain-containing protein [Mycobacterium sp. GA-2829]|uniref:DUF4185 domain-containing protein n=1 Tax=Mycobacterium sp. GA-2829 TaxID=1772283 RepID=UPI00074014F4|nr:DUF4185 domain-containing protein [Mycobacterium sp. GA-2829]KUI38258.1 hypothetical protein AU194_26970 [Mycobacterium sp. GA-2829]
MPALRRLAALTAASTCVASLTLPITTSPPAAADPCSVTAASAPAARSATPGAAPSLTLPKFPVLHLPIGRKPAPKTTPAEAAKADAAVAPETEARAAAAPPASGATIVDTVVGPDPSFYKRFGISGADLGIMWDNGYSGAQRQVLIAFGDTFGNCSLQDQEWRKNTLFRSSSRDLANGLSVANPVPGDKFGGSPVRADRPNFSRQVIQSLNLAATEVTVIPTAGISVGTRQYVNFMSVSQWGAPGQWSTNFSAVAVSDDNGETWTVPATSIRPSWFNTVPGVTFVWGDQNFQMGAYLRHNGYVYAYGTGAGRGGMPFLSRVTENAVADKSAYEYYTPFGWLKGFPFLAIQVVWAPGSEMSVAWNDHLKKFVMLYTNTVSDVVMRTADKPEGPWSSAKTIVTSTAVPGGIYAPYIHPWSSGDDLYFTLSRWSDYSTLLMHTTLG